MYAFIIVFISLNGAPPQVSEATLFPSDLWVLSCHPADACGHCNSAGCDYLSSVRLIAQVLNSGRTTELSDLRRLAGYRHDLRG